MVQELQFISVSDLRSPAMGATARYLGSDFLCIAIFISSSYTIFIPSQFFIYHAYVMTE
jgi:hypothetical protein